MVTNQRIGVSAELGPQRPAKTFGDLVSLRHHNQYTSIWIESKLLVYGTGQQSGVIIVV